MIDVAPNIPEPHGFDEVRLQRWFAELGASLADLGLSAATLQVVAATGSTNDDLQSLALAGASAGTLVLADHQTAGRGRLDRCWHSPPGLNLYFSLLVRPPETIAAQPTLLPLLMALALADTAVALGVATVELKWPNDVLVARRKLAGILAQWMAATPGGPALVLGVGLNVNLTEADLPAELQATATSLRLQLGRRVSREATLALLLERFAHHYRAFVADGAFPWSAWQRYWRSDGRRVRVRQPGITLEGVVRGLSPQGGLRLQTADGTVHTVLAGDVSALDLTE